MENDCHHIFIHLGFKFTLEFLGHVPSQHQAIGLLMHAAVPGPIVRLPDSYVTAQWPQRWVATLVATINELGSQNFETLNSTIHVRPKISKCGLVHVYGLAEERQHLESMLFS